MKQVFKHKMLLRDLTYSSVYLTSTPGNAGCRAHPPGKLVKLKIQMIPQT